MIDINVFIYCIIFFLGTLFGSFFSLAIYRIPIGKDITHERSFCPNCNHRLSFFDMIPLLSYIFLGGKCRYCKKKIRIRYFLLEFMSGLVFLLFAISIKLNILSINTNQIIYFIFGILYIAIVFIIAGIDKEKNKIEKKVLWTGMIFSLIYIITLYFINKDINLCFYCICIILILITEIVDILLYRRNLKNNYMIDILLTILIMTIYSNVFVMILTIMLAILSIILWKILKDISKIKKMGVKETKKENRTVPVEFFLCVSNIICLIICNMFL